MGIDQAFAKQFADNLNGHIAEIVPTKPRYVKSGRGDGSGVFVYKQSERLVYFFEGDVGNLQQGYGVAYLPAGKGLDLRDGKDQENLELEIRLAAGSTTLWIIHEVRAKSLSGTNGRLPSEQTIDKASTPALSQINVLRPVPTIPASLNFIAYGQFNYTNPTTGQQRTVYDPTGTVSAEVTALTSGQHQAAVLYFDADSGTMKVATNTASTAGGTLPSRGEFDFYTFTGITMPASAIPIADVYLYYGQTALTSDDYYKQYDPRPLFTAPRDTWAKITTTNNTTTTVASIAVAELSAVTIVGEYTAAKSDYSAAAGGTFRYTVRRATGGNVTAVASATIVQDEDSGGATPVLSIDIDTGSQTARLRWTGVSAETWYARVTFRVTKV